MKRYYVLNKLNTYGKTENYKFLLYISTKSMLFMYFTSIVYPVQCMSYLQLRGRHYGNNNFLLLHKNSMYLSKILKNYTQYLPIFFTNTFKCVPTKLEIAFSVRF